MRFYIDYSCINARVVNTITLLGLTKKKKKKYWQNFPVKCKLVCIIITIIPLITSELISE